MEYCLIEKWGDGYILPKNCKAIALTPEASYLLKKNEIEFEVLEAFYSFGEVCGDTERYLFSQLSWFKEFDKLVKDFFPEAKELNLNLASLFFYNIKYLVDQIILSSRIINKFIEVVKPSKIWFSPMIYGEDKINRWYWFYFGKSSFFRIIELICRQRGISFNLLIPERKVERLIDSNFKKSLVMVFSGCIDIKNFMKKILPKQILNFVIDFKQYFLLYRCLCINYLFTYQKKCNILILNGKNYIIYNFCKEANRYGFKLFFKRKNKIYSLLRVQKINFGKIGEIKNQIKIDYSAYKFIDEKLMGWVKNQCGFDVSEILNSRFRYLIQELFPQTIVRIKSFIDFYNNNKIDFVVSNVLFSDEDFAAVAATRMSNSTKSVGFCHGVDGFEAKPRFFMEYNLFDLYFASTSGEVEHIKELSNLFNSSRPLVYEYSYLRNYFYVKTKKRTSNGKSNVKKKPVVLFIPIMIKTRPNMPIEKAFPLTMEFVKYHYALIDYFSLRNDYHFIWKALPQTFERGDVVPLILRNRSIKNITYSSTQLNKWLALADRVICDAPSTAFFECIFSRLPVLSFYRPRDQKLREDAYHIFGPSLQPYFSLEEWFKIIEEFLNNDPQKYIVSLPQKEVSVPNILINHLPEQSSFIQKHLYLGEKPIER